MFLLNAYQKNKINNIDHRGYELIRIATENEKKNQIFTHFGRCFFNSFIALNNKKQINQILW